MHRITAVWAAGVVAVGAGVWAQSAPQKTGVVASGNWVNINGQPAAILRTDKQAVLLIALEIDQVQVRGIRVIGNPEKLRGL